MTVYLVGAGPGDPGLLTRRGAEVLARADLVVYDRLSVASLLDLAPPTAELRGVGKRPGSASTPQSEINRILVEEGSTGRTVVRLKGGDPFVFARGGEEAAALADAGVPYEVIPGISSALAVPAYAGIPVTLRHSSTLFTVITGHEDPDKGGEMDWRTVASLGGTIVVLMGVARRARIAELLMEGGLASSTPVAAVTWGTRPEQQTVRATLGELGGLDISAPSVIVIGQVAAQDLDWFESRPLFGWSVVVTRAADQVSKMAAELSAAGAQVIEAPVIRIGPPSDGGRALPEALSRVRQGAYDWLAITSPNGAKRVIETIRDGRDLAGVRIAAIGPGTAETLAAANLVADLVPPSYVAESLLEELTRQSPEPARLLLARAAEARPTLPDGLRQRGWEVDVVEAYRTTPAEITDAQRREIAGADAVTFTSSSTVTNFLAAVPRSDVPGVVACIGPVTADTARSEGLDVTVEAPVHTVSGLVDALVSHARDRDRSGEL